jgi:hypothetical protein
MNLPKAATKTAKINIAVHTFMLHAFRAFFLDTQERGKCERTAENQIIMLFNFGSRSRLFGSSTNQTTATTMMMALKYFSNCNFSCTKKSVFWHQLTAVLFRHPSDVVVECNR